MLKVPTLLLCWPGYFEMPYAVAGDDMLASLKQKCALLKQRLHSLENNRMYHFCSVLCCYTVNNVWLNHVSFTGFTSFAFRYYWLSFSLVGWFLVNRLDHKMLQGSPSCYRSLSPTLAWSLFLLQLSSKLIFLITLIGCINHSFNAHLVCYISNLCSICRSASSDCCC